jgi:tetratricopeptide (TPR) repeat protein
MTIKEIPLRPNDLPAGEEARAVMEDATGIRAEGIALFAEEKYDDALGRVVDALRRLRDFPDYGNREFRALLAVLLFDLSEIHFALKDYRQSEKELEMLFKVLEQLLKDDPDRFGAFHVLAMELSTRILRSRKKTLELLAKQQINTGVLYEKVNAGVAAATDKLVESLRKGAEMMAQTGDYRGAVRFYMEAIKLAKKRSGRVGRREVRMTVDMARVMMHSRNEAARAKRLLAAVLPHAVSLETLELEQEILGMIAKIDADVAHEPMWRTFLEKVQRTAKTRLRRSRKEEQEENKENVDYTEH